MKRVDCLDGLRGLAALWVLVGHCMILTGWRVPIIVQPELGVDLFILLSGFLMVFQYQLRQKKEDWAAPVTWLTFWIRRFFRIAPLFYLMLALALILGPQIYADRYAIDTFLAVEPQRPERYLDGSLINIFMHVSFFFGLLPQYSFRTALPDWSLGLEMQFYAVFPFIVLLARKIGWLVSAVLIAFLGGAMAWALAHKGISFPMPSFLPFKMHLFLCGMLIAADHRGEVWRLRAQIVLAMILAALPIGGASDPIHVFIRELLVLTFFALVHLRSIGLVDWGSNLLGRAFFHWLGELSYGVYLVHLLIMQPVAAWAIARFGTTIGAFERFALVLLIVAPVAYLVAYITYRAVEVPGQHLGKLLLGRITGSRFAAKQVPAEQIAAP
jgi:peptidoglycan/LPS O-acetylase OafA/YrhL